MFKDWEAQFTYSLVIYIFNLTLAASAGGGRLCSDAVGGRAFEYAEVDGHPSTVDVSIRIRKNAKTHY